MTIKEAYNYGAYFLSANGVDEAEFKSLCIACDLGGIKNSEYPLHKNDDTILMKKLADKLWLLKSGEPLQYVLGKWEFYGREFYVGKGVLIPRPETEELTALAIKAVKAAGKCVVYDLCSGSGCIGISIALECLNSTVYLVENSNNAFAYLEKNVQGIDNVIPVKGDIRSEIELPKADIIVSNPPYIKSGDIESLQIEVKKEPVQALDGGKDGLDFYHIINDNWSCTLNRSGRLFLEIGEGQAESIKAVLYNFKDITVHKDMYKNDRIAEATVKDL
ncbi:MAG: peptide chain release factor N(5)-glutamine methyltransferase [Clostridiales bacterium]|nr:peptide chain release factor N(5)-glutamine methyltransferase [Clostridiales bacterium]